MLHIKEEFFMKNKRNLENKNMSKHFFCSNGLKQNVYIDEANQKTEFINF